MSRKGFLSRTYTQSAGYRRASKQEREVADRFSGTTVPGSGSSVQKGDVKGACGGVVRIECKTTAKNSFSITKQMIRKIEEAALPNNELPAIIVEFIDETGKPEMEIAIVPTYALPMLGG